MLIIILTLLLLQGYQDVLVYFTKSQALRKNEKKY